MTDASPRSDLPTSAARPQVTHAMEDYLKAVYRLADSGAAVTTQRLSDELGVTPASVTNMVKRLDDLTLLTHTPYKDVVLTEAGRKIALEIIRHHRLLELYLAETLGVPWDEVHAEAERLEHHLSEELEARMDSALGYPTRDPHGDPIPSRELTLDASVTVRLSEVGVGHRAVVVRVSDRDPAQLRYLGTLGLYPGAAVAVLERHAADSVIRITVEGGAEPTTIGLALAGAVDVVVGGD